MCKSLSNEMIICMILVGVPFAFPPFLLFFHFFIFFFFFGVNNLE